MKGKSKKQSSLASKPALLTLVGVLFFAMLAAAGSIIGNDAVEIDPELEDANIQSAIARTLDLNERFTASDLDLSVENGVVTLTGFVENLPMKRFAVEKIATKKGVTAIVDQTIVRPIERTDEEIRECLTAFFELNYISRDAGVNPLVNDGVVRLMGEVGSFEMSDIAERAAESVVGVRSVVNLLHISPAEEREISEIRQHLKLKAKKDPWVDFDLVKLDVKEGGKVYLSGAVDSMGERYRLIEMVKVNGVTEVNSDDLLVDPSLVLPGKKPTKPARVNDAVIAEAVEKALKVDPRVRAGDIEVSVIAGVVSMKGDVASIGAKNAAIKNGKNTVGVTQVYDLLKINPGTSLSDDMIKRNGAMVLRGHTLLAGLEVGVDFENGVVTLVGESPTKFQRTLAEDLASRLPGAKEVKNKIRLINS